jgi:hypothetical protein
VIFRCTYCIRSGIAFILGEHHMYILSLFAYCWSNVCRVKGHKHTLEMLMCTGKVNDFRFCGKQRCASIFVHADQNHVYKT